MKTAEEVIGWWRHTNLGLIQLIEARDAEHRAELDALRKSYEDANACGGEANERLRAELLKLQDDLLQAANREAALEAEIERLKGELAEAKRLLIDANVGTRLPVDVREAVLRFLAATTPAKSTPVPTLASCSNPRLDCGPNGCATCPRRLPSHTYSVDCPCDKCGKEKASRLQYATLDPGRKPVPPDDIRERLERLEVVVAALNEGRRVRDWPAVAALEAKGEPGEFAPLHRGHWCIGASCVMCKGAKP